MAWGPADRRRAPRQDVRHEAAIVNPWGSPVLCGIVDFNPQGARVLVQDVPAGDDIHLIDLDSRTAYHARVVWRRPPQIGTRFVETWRLDSAATPEWIKTAAAKAARVKARRRGRFFWPGTAA
jgi:hypothetical protein